MYCTPLEVWDDMGLTSNASESFTDVGNGDTLELNNTNLIQKAFPSDDNEFSQDQDVVVIDDSTGSVQSTGDYEVDLRDGSVKWNGSSSLDLVVRYKYAPVPNSTVVSHIESAKETIDDRTNTVYNGTESTTVTLDGKGKVRRFYALPNRPVESVSTVKVNRADLGEANNWEELSEGRDADYVSDAHGITFTTREAAPADSIKNLEVSFTYGNSSTPEEINKVAAMLTKKALFQDNTVSQALDGRDDYNPKTGAGFLNEIDDIINRHRIEHYGSTD